APRWPLFPYTTLFRSRLLVPLTRGHGNGAALQFEVELTDLDQLDQFRNRGVGSAQETGNWMHAFSEVLVAPPCVEILRFEEAKRSEEHTSELQSRGHL